MKAQKVVFGFAVLLAMTALASCTNESANDEQLYEQQAIDKDEITEDDT